MGHERGNASIAGATMAAMMVAMMMSMVFAAAPTPTTPTPAVVTTVKWDLNVTNQYPDNTLKLDLNSRDNVLVFNYTTSAHNLVQVRGITAYTNCDNTSAINIYTTGNNTFPVSREGTQYFICGVSDHCKTYKMKLAVTASST